MKITVQFPSYPRPFEVSYEEVKNKKGVYLFRNSPGLRFVSIGYGPVFYIYDGSIEVAHEESWKYKKFERLDEDVEIKFVPVPR